jgi:dimethylhistidine N-methyltransferase
MADALHGLAQNPPSLPPKYFYNADGTQLFEQITRLPEYYPTTSELEILENLHEDMHGLSGAGRFVVEFGAHSGRKAGILLNALDRPSGYAAMDISREAALGAAEDIAEGFPDLTAGAIIADFTQDLPGEVAEAARAPRLAFFPGSTIGNFDEAERQGILKTARALVGEGGALLLGADLRKERDILEPAYNDSAGVTAAFNLNILRRLRDELGAELDLDHFRHTAVWVEPQSRIEMRLVARQPTAIRLNGESFAFSADDYVHTESSRKFSRSDLEAMGKAHGFELGRLWTDSRGFFAMAWFDAV